MHYSSEVTMTFSEHELCMCSLCRTRIMTIINYAEAKMAEENCNKFINRQFYYIRIIFETEKLHQN
jgi:hypothetical protein